jgi:hypothetical protein
MIYTFPAEEQVAIHAKSAIIAAVRTQARELQDKMVKDGGKVAFQVPLT